MSVVVLTLRFLIVIVLYTREHHMPHYTKKIQISLTQEQHRALLKVAARERKDVEVIVREAVERTCLAQDQTETVRHAATVLLELARQAETRAPEDYQDWEEEYARVKWSNHGG